MHSSLKLFTYSVVEGVDNRKGDAVIEDIITCSDCGQILTQSDTVCPKCKSRKRHIRIFSKESIEVHYQIREKQKRPGKKKPIREFKVGDDYHKDSGKWNYLERDINRESKEYEETIIDKSTGEIIHHCKEPLPNHIGHGSAKKRKKDKSLENVSSVVQLSSTEEEEAKSS